MSQPNFIDGDSATSAICINGQKCGNKDSLECSGGYECDSISNLSEINYSWPSDTPKPDDINKIQQKCNIPETNFGRSNNDQKLKLSDNDLSNQITKPWEAQAKFGPSKPNTITSKL